MALEIPSEKAVRNALARLVAHGVESVWLPDIQPLFELPAVRAKLDELGEDQAAAALRAVLERTVKEMGQSQYRSLLSIVLGLDPEFRDLPAGERRRIAGLKFRGGDRPVGPGTIRQHHEPKALDELAELLVSVDLRPDSTQGDSAGLWLPVGVSELPLEWHPHLHRQWAGEQLIFWRLSVAGYRRREALDAIREGMRAAGVRSWSVFELLGVFDVLISAWLPGGSAESDMRSALVTEFGGRLELIDAFIVDKVVSHWAWSDEEGSLRLPSPEVAANPLASREIDQLNQGGQGLELDRFERLNVVSRHPTPSGIGFFVALSLEGHALVVTEAHRNLESQIVEVVRKVPRGRFSQLCIYQGSGFTNFLIHGVVNPESFSDLNQFLVQLADAAPYASPRINTFVASFPVPLEAHESMPGGSPGGDDPGAVELLKQGEGPRLEIKVSAFSDLSGSARSVERLAMDIAAFLNTDGGTVVIGALDLERAEQRPDLMELPAVRDAPRVEGYLVTGIDHELKHGLERYALRLHDLFEQLITPAPAPFLQTRFETISGRAVCIVRISPDSASDGMWFYCESETGELKFPVRQDSTVRTLQGPGADQYKRARPRT